MAEALARGAPWEALHVAALAGCAGGFTGDELRWLRARLSPSQLKDVLWAARQQECPQCGEPMGNRCDDRCPSCGYKGVCGSAGL